jgi:hypothetical protein
VVSLPGKLRKKRRLSDSENGCTRMRATYPKTMSGSYDFVMYLTEYGRRLKISVALGTGC